MQRKIIVMDPASCCWQSRNFLPLQLVPGALHCQSVRETDQNYSILLITSPTKPYARKREKYWCREKNPYFCSREYSWHFNHSLNCSLIPPWNYLPSTQLAKRFHDTIICYHAKKGEESKLFQKRQQETSKSNLEKILISHTGCLTTYLKNYYILQHWFRIRCQSFWIPPLLSQHTSILQLTALALLHTAVLAKAAWILPILTETGFSSSEPYFLAEKWQKVSLYSVLERV